MCSTPGPISLASPTIFTAVPNASSRFPAIRVSSVPTQYRKNASPAISAAMTMTVQTTSAVMT